MNYASELKKFITSQYIYSGTRIALAVVIPSIILAYLGLLKEFFLFPLGTLFLALTDSTGSFSPKKKRTDSCLWILFLCLADCRIAEDFHRLFFRNYHFRDVLPC